MAETATVGILKTMLTMDTSSYDAGAKKATGTSQKLKTELANLSGEVQKLAPLAERMVRGFGGDKLLHVANSLTAAVTKIGGATKLTEAEQARANRTLTAAIEKYRALGQAAPKAMLDLERATRGAASASDSFLTKNVALGSFVGAFGAQLGMSAVRGLVSFGRQVITNAGNVVDLATKLGVSTDAVQEFQHVSSQTGVPIEAFSKGVYRLGLNLAGGGDSLDAALKRVGTSLKELRTLSPEEQFKRVLDGLSTIHDEGERGLIGNLLLGKSYEQLAGVASQSYSNMARDAKKSTREQLEALDDLGDELELWKRQMGDFGTSLFGGAIKANRQFWGKMLPVIDRQAGDGSAIKFHGSGEGMARINAEAAAAAEKNTKAQQDYAKQLASVRAELAKLTPQQRTQIDAALALGVSTDDVEKQFGLAAGVLRLYSAQLKGAETASTKLAQSQKELAAQAARTAEIMFDVQVQMDRAMLARQKSPMTILGDLGPKSPEELIAGMTRNLEAITHLSPLEIFGDLVPQVESAESLIAKMRQDLEDLEAPGRRAGEIMRDIFSPILRGALTGIGSMLFGGASDAERHYKAMKAGGKASAEELTRAFRAWKDSERDVWAEFNNALKQTLKDFLDSFIDALASAAFGGGGGGKGGFVGQAAQWAVGKLLGGGAAAGTSGAVLSSSAIPLASSVGHLATPVAITSQGASAGIASGASGGTAAAGGGGLAGAGGAATAPAWLTTALPIAGFASAAIWALTSPASHINPEMGKFLLSSGGDWRQRPSAFNAMKRGEPLPPGFGPPSVTMPSMSGHAAGIGWQSNRAMERSTENNVHLTVNVSALDGADVKRVFDERILPEFKRALRDNKQWINGDIRRATNA